MTDFEEIYNKYFKDIYKYVLCLCKNETIAQDITQDTFFKALNNIDTFNGNCKLNVWLCQIAKNTYFTYYQKEKKVKFNTNENSLLEKDFENSFIDSESAFELHKLLHKLQEPYKEVFSLRIFGEMSFCQIGEIFQKSESWARVTFYRAKLKIKEELK